MIDTPAPAILGDPSHDRPGAVWYDPVRVIALGQAPSRDGDPTLPLTGRPMQFLCKVIGMHYLSWCACTLRYNLIREFPGYAGGGDAFPMDRARAGAQRLLLSRHFDVPRIVLCWGPRVGQALGLEPDKPLWSASLVSPSGVNHVVAGIPHPSGRNRWWNDAANREEARLFVRMLFESASTIGRMFEEMEGRGDGFSRRADPKNWGDA
jgi:hypothetical protein